MISKKNSPDAKQVFDFLDEEHFYIHENGKNYAEKILMKNFYNKSALLASGLQETIFLSENPNEFCKRLFLINHEKQTGNCSMKFESEIIAVVDSFFEYKSITPNESFSKN